jgi:hypothetical protein
VTAQEDGPTGPLRVSTDTTILSTIRRQKGSILRNRLALLLVAGAAAFGAAAVAPASQAAGVTLAAPAKTCSSSYTHAVIGGVQKCLRAGEFCTHAFDSQYRGYGFRCIRYYANVGRYRLTHA